MDEQQQPVVPDSNGGAEGGDQEISVRHSVHHPDRIDVRIHGSGRSAMDAPVSQFQTLVKRILWYTIMGLLTIMVAFGAAYYTAAKGDYRDCRARNLRTERTSKALAEVAAAMDMEGDKKQAVVLKRFLDQDFKATVPECAKPPFTKEYPAPTPAGGS